MRPAMEIPPFIPDSPYNDHHQQHVGTPISPSDGELWRAFKSGEEEAFVYIYNQYFTVLVNYCYQFTQDKELIKDCVQDLFIFLRSKRETVSHIDHIKLYLLKSCRNRILSYIKKQQKHEHIFFLHSDNQYFMPVASPEENLIRAQAREHLTYRMQDAIKKLSEKEREVIYYYYFENLSYADIAELMGYEHVKSVRSLLYKALAKLKNLYLIFLMINEMLRY